jgi:hypothetical protein
MARGKQQKHGTKKSKTLKHQSIANDSFIGSYDEAPTFSKDNQHIFSGYRINYDTPKKIFKTLFMMHNESVNIWSHLFAAIIVIAIIVYAIVFINPYVATQNGEKITFNEQVREHLKYFENLTLINEITEGADSEIELLKHNLNDAYQ